MLPGECQGTDAKVLCAGDDDLPHAPLELPLQVCQSAAGYYLGYWCPHCGPISRETEYYCDFESAATDLRENPNRRMRL